MHLNLQDDIIISVPLRSKQQQPTDKWRQRNKIKKGVDKHLEISYDIKRSLEKPKSEQQIENYGEVSERFKEPVLKTGDSERGRGFESHPLRQSKKQTVCGEVPKWLKGLAWKASRSVTRHEGSNPSFSVKYIKRTYVK